MQRKRAAARRNHQHATVALDALLHPAQAFAHPLDVVNDPDLTPSEKRAILAAWASDANSGNAIAVLRPPPGAQPVHFEEIMAALRTLDQQVRPFKPQPHYRHVLDKRIPGVFGRQTRDDRDQPLH